MLEFDTWRELAAAYVKVTARAAGWAFAGVRPSRTTRSIYLVFRNASRVVIVRLSDHRGCRPRLKGPGIGNFSVNRNQPNVMERWELLPRFLADQLT